MQKKFMLVALGLLIFAVATAILTFYLAAHPYKPEASGMIRGDTRLPDLKAIKDIPTRKALFIGTLEPLIARKNTALSKVRADIERIARDYAETQALSRRDELRLERLSARYKIDASDTDVRLAELLTHADTLPASMVLAQAAAESGWGTSRFARQGQNLFGQWCYTKGCGMVPKQRSRGARHEVQSFASLEDAINAYYYNINSHRAYAQLRTRRAYLRTENHNLKGSELITGLGSYSSRGKVYINELAELIRYNRLDRFDSSGVGQLSQE